MRRGREIIGLPIIDLSSGERVAEVKDILCSLEDQRISALLVDKGSLLRPSKLVRWENIHSIGHDAVTIDSRDVITTVKKTSTQQNSPNRYLGKQVLTTSGQYLGRVDDIALDPVRGNIVGCVLTDGIVGDFISGRAIIPLVDSTVTSTNNIVVSDEPIDLSFKWGVDSEDIEMPNVQ